MSWARDGAVAALIIQSTASRRASVLERSCNIILNTYTKKCSLASVRAWGVESDATPGQFRTWAEPLITQVCSYIGENSIEHDDLMDTATQAMRVVMDEHVGPLTIKVDPVEAKRREARRRADEVKRKIKGSNPYDG